LGCFLAIHSQHKKGLLVENLHLNFELSSFARLPNYCHNSVFQFIIYRVRFNDANLQRFQKCKLHVRQTLFTDKMIWDWYSCRQNDRIFNKLSLASHCRLLLYSLKKIKSFQKCPNKRREEGHFGVSNRPPNLAKF
jgi:hypothetical protein